MYLNGESGFTRRQERLIEHIIMKRKCAGAMCKALIAGIVIGVICTHVCRKKLCGVFDNTDKEIK